MVVLDRALHILGQRLHSFLEAASHVVGERRVEVFLLVLCILFLCVSGLVAEPGARIERHLLGLFPGETRGLRDGPHEVVQAHRYESGQGGAAPLDDHQVGELGADVQQQGGPFVEERVRKGGAREGEGLDVDPSRTQAASSHRRGITPDHLPVGCDHEYPVQV